MAEGDILQKLLEGQERIASDLRNSIERQQVSERSAEAAKTNLFGLTCKVSEVFTTQVEVIDAVDYNSEDILDLREEVRDNQIAIRDNAKKNKEILKMLHRVNERLDKLERRQLEMGIEIKAKSVVVNGLDELPNEIPVQRAFDFLKCIDVTLKIEEIDIAYRIGSQDTRSVDKSPRSLIVIFYGLSKKRSIMDLKNKLKNNQDYQKVFVNDDLPVEARQNREQMREISNYAKEHGFESKVSGDKLTVNGRIYQHHELDLLPREINLEKIRTRKRGDGIAFQGETSCLSNFYPCQINMWDQSFNCSEQAYQYMKCITCDKEETAHKIMLLSLPRDIKAKGDKSETTPKWENMKLAKMEEIVTQKFLQNMELRKKLCDTGDFTLYEATSNLYWGCGLRLNSRMWSSGITPGKNHMGQILMKVRDKMRDFSADLRRGMVPTPEQNVRDISASTQTKSSLTQVPATKPVEQKDKSSEPQEPSREELDMDTMSSSVRDVNQPESLENSGQQDAGTESESMNSSSSSVTNREGCTSFRDFTTNHEIDISKVNAWSLPTVKRNTKEWTEKQKARGLLKRRRSDRRDNNTTNVYHSTPHSRSPTHSHSPPQRKRISRSFVNSSYQSQLVKEHGYDLESNYKRAMASYNQSNITDRKGGKQT